MMMRLSVAGQHCMRGYVILTLMIATGLLCGAAAISDRRNDDGLPAAFPLQPQPQHQLSTSSSTRRVSAFVVTAAAASPSSPPLSHLLDIALQQETYQQWRTVAEKRKPMLHIKHQNMIFHHAGTATPSSSTSTSNVHIPARRADDAAAHTVRVLQKSSLSISTATANVSIPTTQDHGDPLALQPSCAFDNFDSYPVASSTQDEHLPLELYTHNGWEPWNLDIAGSRTTVQMEPGQYVKPGQELRGHALHITPNDDIVFAFTGDGHYFSAGNGTLAFKLFIESNRHSGDIGAYYNLQFQYDPRADRFVFGWQIYIAPFNLQNEASNGLSVVRDSLGQAVASFTFKYDAWCTFSHDIDLDRNAHSLAMYCVEAAQTVGETVLVLDNVPYTPTRAIPATLAAVNFYGYCGTSLSCVGEYYVDDFSLDRNTLKPDLPPAIYASLPTEPLTAQERTKTDLFIEFSICRPVPPGGQIRMTFDKSMHDSVALPVAESVSANLTCRGSITAATVTVEAISRHIMTISLLSGQTCDSGIVRIFHERADIRYGIEGTFKVSVVVRDDDTSLLEQFQVDIIVAERCLNFVDDFEAYSPNTYLHSQALHGWELFSGSDGSDISAANISSQFARNISGTAGQSMHVEEGHDIVFDFVGSGVSLDRGTGEVSFWMYLDANGTDGLAGGVVGIMHHFYSELGEYGFMWDFIFMPQSSESFSLFYNTRTKVSYPFSVPYDAWFEVHLLLSLDGNSLSVVVDGNKVYNGQFAPDEFVELAGLNFWGFCFPTSSCNADYYVDDFAVSGSFQPAPLRKGVTLFAGEETPLTLRFVTCVSIPRSGALVLNFGLPVSLDLVSVRLTCGDRIDHTVPLTVSHTSDATTVVIELTGPHPITGSCAPGLAVLHLPGVSMPNAESTLSLSVRTFKSIAHYADGGSLLQAPYLWEVNVVYPCLDIGDDLGSFYGGSVASVLDQAAPLHSAGTGFGKEGRWHAFMKHETPGIGGMLSSVDGIDHMVVNNATDLVYVMTQDGDGFGTGMGTVMVRLFVPSANGSSGHLELLVNYDTERGEHDGGSLSTLRLFFESASSEKDSFLTSHDRRSQAKFRMIYDQWVDITFYIDLDANSLSMYLNDAFIFAGHYHPTGIVNNHHTVDDSRPRFTTLAGIRFACPRSAHPGHCTSNFLVSDISVRGSLRPVSAATPPILFSHHSDATLTFWFLICNPVPVGGALHVELGGTTLSLPDLDRVRVSVECGNGLAAGSRLYDAVPAGSNDLIQSVIYTNSSIVIYLGGVGVAGASCPGGLAALTLTAIATADEADIVSVNISSRDLAGHVVETVPGMTVDVISGDSCAPLQSVERGAFPDGACSSGEALAHGTLCVPTCFNESMRSGHIPWRCFNGAYEFVDEVPASLMRGCNSGRCPTPPRLLTSEGSFDWSPLVGDGTNFPLRCIRGAIPLSGEFGSAGQCRESKWVSTPPRCTAGVTCDFEANMCGWYSLETAIGAWHRLSVPASEVPRSFDQHGSDILHHVMAIDRPGILYSTAQKLHSGTCVAVSSFRAAGSGGTPSPAVELQWQMLDNNGVANINGWNSLLVATSESQLDTWTRFRTSRMQMASIEELNGHIAFRLVASGGQAGGAETFVNDILLEPCAPCTGQFCYSYLPLSSAVCDASCMIPASWSCVNMSTGERATDQSLCHIHDVDNARDPLTKRIPDISCAVHGGGACPLVQAACGFEGGSLCSWTQEPSITGPDDHQWNVLTPEVQHSIGEPSVGQFFLVSPENVLHEERAILVSAPLRPTTGGCFGMRYRVSDVSSVLRLEFALSGTEDWTHARSFAGLGTWTRVTVRIATAFPVGAAKPFRIRLVASGPRIYVDDLYVSNNCLATAPGVVHVRLEFVQRVPPEMLDLMRFELAAALHVPLYNVNYYQILRGSILPTDRVMDMIVFPRLGTTERDLGRSVSVLLGFSAGLSGQVRNFSLPSFAINSFAWDTRPYAKSGGEWNSADVPFIVMLLFSLGLFVLIAVLCHKCMAKSVAEDGTAGRRYGGHQQLGSRYDTDVTENSVSRTGDSVVELDGIQMTDFGRGFGQISDTEDRGDGASGASPRSSAPAGAAAMPVVSTVAAAMVGSGATTAGGGSSPRPLQDNSSAVNVHVSSDVNRGASVAAADGVQIGGFNAVDDAPVRVAESTEAKYPASGKHGSPEDGGSSSSSSGSGSGSGSSATSDSGSSSCDSDDGRNDGSAKDAAFDAMFPDLGDA